MSDPQHRSQSPLPSQEGSQDLEEQDLEMITGGGYKVVSDEKYGKPYAQIYNSVSSDLRQPLLTSNQSEAIKVSENMIAKETPNFLQPAEVRFQAPRAIYNKGKFEGEVKPY